MIRYLLKLVTEKKLKSGLKMFDKFNGLQANPHEMSGEHCCLNTTTSAGDYIRAYKV